MTKTPRVPAATAAAGADGRGIAGVLGAVLRRTRADLGMSRKTMASRLLISTSTLQRIEDGDPSVALGFYLGASEILGVPLLAVEIDAELARGGAKGSAHPRARRKTLKDYFA